MAQPPIFEWHGKEYSSEQKGADWYWAVSIVAVAIVVACILFNNFLLALVVIAATVAACLQAAKHPRIHRFYITERGVGIDTHFYQFEDMLHFSVLEYLDETLPPALSIKTKHIFAPHLLIPIIGYDPLDVYDYVAAHLPEGKHDESAMDRIIDLLQL
jgi:hypothetical protein